MEDYKRKKISGTKKLKMVKSEMSDAEDNFSKSDLDESSNSSSSPTIDVVADESFKQNHLNENNKMKMNGRSEDAETVKMPFRPFASLATRNDQLPGLAGGGFFNPGLPLMDPKTLVEAYAARLQSEADYARYLKYFILNILCDISVKHSNQI